MRRRSNLGSRTIKMSATRTMFTKFLVSKAYNYVIFICLRTEKLGKRCKLNFQNAKNVLNLNLKENWKRFSLLEK